MTERIKKVGEFCPVCNHKLKINEVRKNNELYKILSVWNDFENLLKNKDNEIDSRMLSDFYFSNSGGFQTVLCKKLMLSIRFLCSEIFNFNSTLNLSWKQSMICKIRELALRSGASTYPYLAQVDPDYVRCVVEQGSDLAKRFWGPYAIDTLCELAKSYSIFNSSVSKCLIDKAFNLLKFKSDYHFLNKMRLKLLIVYLCVNDPDDSIKFVLKLVKTSDFYIFQDKLLLILAKAIARKDAKKSSMIVDLLSSNLEMYLESCPLEEAIKRSKFLQKTREFNFLSKLGKHLVSIGNRTEVVDVLNKSLLLASELFESELKVTIDFEYNLIGFSRALRGIGRGEDAERVLCMIKRPELKTRAFVAVAEASGLEERERLLQRALDLVQKKHPECGMLAEIVRGFSPLLSADRVAALAKMTYQTNAKCAVAKAIYLTRRDEAVGILDKQLQYVMDKGRNARASTVHDELGLIIEAYIEIDIERALDIAWKSQHMAALFKVVKAFTVRDRKRAMQIVDQVSEEQLDFKCRALCEIVKQMDEPANCLFNI